MYWYIRAIEHTIRKEPFQGKQRCCFAHATGHGALLSGMTDHHRPGAGLGPKCRLQVIAEGGKGDEEEDDDDEDEDKERKAWPGWPVELGLGT